MPITIHWHRTPKCGANHHASCANEPGTEDSCSVLKNELAGWCVCTHSTPEPGMRASALANKRVTVKLSGRATKKATKKGGRKAAKKGARKAAKKGVRKTARKAARKRAR